MAYITKSNARHLEFQANREAIKKIMIVDLYKLSLWMLTKKEQQWLAAAKMFYSNPEFYIDHIYEKVERTSSSNLVYVSGTPAYHENKNCDVLARDYLNYVIPPEIVDRGNAKVAQFREWWKSEEALLKSDPQRFLEKMGIRWLLKNPPTLNSIQANNSGIEAAENRDINKVEEEIGALVQSMNAIRSAHSVLINKFGKVTFAIKKGNVQIDDPTDRSILDDWDEKKDSLKDSLRLYFQLRFNPELEMVGTVLESVGFRPCMQCHEKR